MENAYTTYWKPGLKNVGVLHKTSKLINSECLQDIYLAFLQDIYKVFTPLYTLTFIKLNLTNRLGKETGWVCYI